MEKSNAKSSWVRGSCIGRGSFGTVSLAVNKSNGDVFAVKSVDQSSCLPAQVEALENEIRILRSISSPYVVEYLGDDCSYEFPTTSYRNLHLEYLPSGTVADLAKMSGGTDVDEGTVRKYTWCIVSAMKYVHSKGITHCDVKGKNVLVGSTPGTAKLTDFGSAMEFVDSVPSTSGGKLMGIKPRGSPLWMAPEVVRGEFQGPESDVWSLGCTVIEIITGKPAWEDRGSETLFRIGYSEELPEFPTQLSELGRDFLEKCLRRVPGKRWTCDELLQHPFISSSSPSNQKTYSSPRCILDWFSSEFDEEDNEVCETEDLNSKAKDRISELASNKGANWESDGWVVVRNFITEREAASDACCRGDEGEGTSSSYPDLIRSEDESTGTNVEYSYFNDSPWPVELVNKYGVVHGVAAANSSCQYGSPERKGIYSCCKLILYYLFLYYYNFICSYIQ